MVRRKLESYIKIMRNILFLLIIIMLLVAYKTRKKHQREVASSIPKGALKHIFFKKKNPIHVDLNIDRTRELVHRYNIQEKILNIDAYGPIKKDTVIFVVSVHTLTIYLELLLVSLSEVQGISDTLVIFSHLYYDENINTLIESIDFCRVLQIFYPYSTQLYTHEFPGFHWRDCPHDMTIKEAESINCTGAYTPDIHGYYRDVVKAEKKHFWWWTANTVFEKLTCTNNHSGSVVFLNDDVYLLKDSIYMIILMKQLTETLNHGELLSLNAISYTADNKNGPYHVEIMTWDPPNDPDVLVLDSSVWNSIASQYDLFCYTDDYSWARSLYYLSLNRRDGSQFRIVSTVVPRAYKTSACGLQGYLVDCDAIESVYQVLNLQKELEEDMFPAHIETYIHIDLEDVFLSFDYAWSNGGFNDPRDKEFCRNITRSKIRKALLDMQNEFTDFKSDGM